MKEVIVLRHAKRIGDTLTPEGVTNCRELAARIGRIDVAVASERNRARQTAALLSGKDVKTDRRANIPFMSIKPMLNLVQDTFAGLEDGQRALIVTHEVVISELRGSLHAEDFSENLYGFRELQGMVITEDLHAKPFNIPDLD